MAKPHIDRVCLAFYVFQSETMAAIIRYETASAAQAIAFDSARVELRRKLIDLGLADHIDWSAL